MTDFNFGNLFTRGDEMATSVGQMMSDPATLALISGLGANILKGQNSALAPAASGIEQFVKSLAAAKGGTQAMIGQPQPQAPPSRVAQLPTPSVNSEPVQVQQDPQVKALVNANKALGEAMLATQPQPAGGSQPQANPTQASTMETSSAVPQNTSEVQAVAGAPISNIQSLVDMVSQGPKQVTNPFVGYINPDPYTLAATGSPEAVNATLATAIAAEAARQNAQARSTADYQQTVDALKALDAASKTPTEILKQVSEIGKIADERSGALETAKKRGELAAIAEDVERVAKMNDGVSVPLIARPALAGTKIKTMGDVYRATGSADPKLINTFLKAFVDLRNGELSAKALNSDFSKFAARLYQEQIENRTRQIAALTAKVRMPTGKDASNIDIQTLMGMQKSGILQPQEVELLSSLISERESAQGLLDSVLTGMEQKPKSEAAKRKEKAVQGGNEIKLDKTKAVPATHPQLPSAAYKQDFGNVIVWFDKSGNAIGKTTKK